MQRAWLLNGQVFKVIILSRGGENGVIPDKGKEGPERELTTGEIIFSVAVTVFFLGCLFFGPW